MSLSCLQTRIASEGWPEYRSNEWVMTASGETGPALHAVCHACFFFTNLHSNVLGVLECDNRCIASILSHDNDDQPESSRMVLMALVDNEYVASV